MFLKRDDPHSLIVGVAGVKMGDRLVQIGCADGGRLGAVAGKVGLSGRAVLAAPDESSAARGRRGAEKAGVLIEVEIAPPTRLPFNAEDFDVAIVDDTGGLFGGLRDGDRSAAILEAARILRPAGRLLLIGSAPRAGIGAIFSRAPDGPRFAEAAEEALKAGGFKAVRTLAERDGLAFVEGTKPRTNQG
jgi:ubiquinone/menaquinone biosynthesis C-methylase UbiE